MALLAIVYQSLFVYLPWTVFGYLLLTTFQAWYPLRKFKGPFLGSFSNVWHFRAMRSKSMHLKYYDALQNYGELARISPKELVTADPDFVRRMNGARSSYSRSDWYDVMKPDATKSSVFTERNVKTHDTLRAKMMPGVSVEPRSCLIF